MRSVHKAILDEIIHGKSSPQTLLDVGCGRGEFTKILASYLRKTKITAVDTVKRPYLIGKNITFMKGSAEHLPLEDESFDMVIAALSLHHWKDKTKGIEEVYRVLKKGGSFIIGDPLLEGWLRNRFWGWFAQITDGGKFTDIERISKDLNKVGFKSIHIELIPNSMNTLYLITATKD